MLIKTLKFIIFTVALGIASIFGSFFIHSAIASWTDPADNPPNGNISEILFQDPLFIDYANKRVGIGTNTPNRDLHIYKVSGDNAEIDIQSVAGANNHWGIYHDRLTDELRFWQGDDRMKIAAGGNLAVTGRFRGASAPVFGNDAATKAYIDQAFADLANSCSCCVDNDGACPSGIGSECCSGMCVNGFCKTACNASDKNMKCNNGTSNADDGLCIPDDYPTNSIWKCETNMACLWGTDILEVPECQDNIWCDTDIYSGPVYGFERDGLVCDDNCFIDGSLEIGEACCSWYNCDSDCCNGSCISKFSIIGNSCSLGSDCCTQYCVSNQCAADCNDENNGQICNGPTNQSGICTKAINSDNNAIQTGCEFGSVCLSTKYTPNYYSHENDDCNNNDECDTNVGDSQFIREGRICNDNCILDQTILSGQTCCHNDNCESGLTCVSGICQ